MSTVAPVPSAPGTPPALLTVRGLTTEVKGPDASWFPVVREVDLEIPEGRTLGVAGESGSGKTMLALTILGLLPQSGVRVAAGRVDLDGTDLIRASAKQIRVLLGRRMSAVFQDPLTSLNPLFTVGEQISEAIRRHGDVTRRAASIRAGELLESVHIDNVARRLRAYPHELSGGQRQRAAIAIAIANEPALLIADEPTTALDVTVQADILDLLAELQRRMGMAMLFITHDLGVARDIADRVVVMYAGGIMEEAGTEELAEDPAHPYTRRLMSCAPRLGHRGELRPIPGMPPALDHLPPGCPFADRCDVVTAGCRVDKVELTPVGDRRVACIRPGARP